MTSHMSKGYEFISGRLRSAVGGELFEENLSAAVEALFALDARPFGDRLTPSEYEALRSLFERALDLCSEHDELASAALDSGRHLRTWLRRAVSPMCDIHAPAEWSSGGQFFGIAEATARDAAVHEFRHELRLAAARGFRARADQSMRDHASGVLADDKASHDERAHCAISIVDRYLPEVLATETAAGKALLAQWNAAVVISCGIVADECRRLLAERAGAH